MSKKKVSRLRRAQKTRANIRVQEVLRLCVFRSPRHIYAQVIGIDGGTVLASASTVDPELRKALGNGGNRDAAKEVGRMIAEKAKAAGVERVAFDRSGYKYHGRVKALADAARENGLQF
ncbi:MAG: 50S ribosomal protein L18 [Arenicellales bacterium]|jgi:large subunit ribosomal protein L18|nr:50S ribosomal protein L18 [Acidiferrobacteraceae bacterium]MDP6123291.1 50S ribosomal protein L18 [Arenicellales bacterium]MBT58227.1 50S ribosomal protein L18 [Acidiferrobacteraceae bacterium]MDP6290028.1 50S ribosomal protein L18 [Arenicellales bacterium]MDP6434019.1 50S ribosomal protein L18 [Arenicellales bacterium]|tara:strand:- start:1666 stop:2022 length:357 start_codon:yes stop_codon:yes gene_type:complete